MRFDVTPLGSKYYEHLMNQIGEPIEKLEKSLTGYLDVECFQRTYAIAYQKWRDAEQLLWAADSSQQLLTTIGHLCREAMQEFASTLMERYRLQEAYPDKSKTIARIAQRLKCAKAKLATRSWTC